MLSGFLNRPYRSSTSASEHDTRLLNSIAGAANQFSFISWTHISGLKSSVCAVGETFSGGEIVFAFRCLASLVRSVNVHYYKINPFATVPRKPVKPERSMDVSTFLEGKPCTVAAPVKLCILFSNVWNL